MLEIREHVLWEAFAKVIHNGNDIVNYFKYGKSMNYLSIRGCDTYMSKQTYMSI